MSKQYRPYEPDQSYLLPPSLDEWLPDDHLVRFIDDIVGELDLESIYASYESELRGFPPYHPLMMTKVLIYAYATGVYSSRKIEQRLYEDIAFRYLASNNFPDFRTINTFRKRHLQAFQHIFMQVLELCKKAGMVKLGTVAIDGTKIKANASKHKAMSYKRMKQEEQRLKAEVKHLIEQAEKIDAEEDRRYGDQRGNELPEELRFREQRLAKIREAKSALEAEALAKSQSEASLTKQDDKDNDDDDDVSPAPDVKDVKVEDKTQRNFTDPDSRILKAAGKHQFIQGYNVQLTVDAESQIILNSIVHQSSADTRQLIPALDAVQKHIGQPLRVVADAGYYSKANVEESRRRRIAPFIPPHKVKHSEWRTPSKLGRLPKNATEKERMSRFIRTKRGKEIYKLRQQSVEAVNGQIKSTRGFDRFSLRGLANVAGEWDLVALAHNVLKLFRQNKGLGAAVC